MNGRTRGAVIVGPQPPLARSQMVKQDGRFSFHAFLWEQIKCLVQDFSTSVRNFSRRYTTRTLRALEIYYDIIYWAILGFKSFSDEASCCLKQAEENKVLCIFEGGGCLASIKGTEKARHPPCHSAVNWVPLWSDRSCNGCPSLPLAATTEVSFQEPKQMALWAWRPNEFKTVCFNQTCSDACLQMKTIFPNSRLTWTSSFCDELCSIM